MTAQLEKKRSDVEVQLAAILRESAGLELSRLNRSATFLELGFDSLFLIQLSQRIKRRLGVKVAFRQLIEDVATVDGLLEYLASNAPEKAASPVPVPSGSGSIAAVSQESSPPAPIPSPDPVAKATEVISVHSTASSPPSELKLTTPPTSACTEVSSVGNPALFPQEAQAVVPPRLVVTSSAVEQIILQQNELMLKHLDLLTRSKAATARPPGSSGVDRPGAEQHVSALTGASSPAPIPGPEITSASADVNAGRCESEPGCPVASPIPSAQSAETKNFERFGPYKPVRRGIAGGLTDQQQRHLDQFMQRYTRRTAKSRSHAQTYRQRFADPRGVAGYRRIWKSMVYQIVVERSKGSKLWDIDGNEYIDIAMGFGLNLFGQSPDFVTQALHRQLDRGVEVGPQTPFAGEAAELLCQFSRKDRVTFCNTGSEAVMAALRLARTVTGKTKTVYFNKDYHGNFDQVLLRSPPGSNPAGSAPAAPGVPECYTDNTLVLPYGTDQSLEIIRRNAHDIAAVLVEPVQSADPFIQPREFLHQLRELTQQNRIAMVMDEVISGFRAAPGGAQEWYGVWGDMATYGKVLGGGMPIGALAGTAEYMDALDGGQWRYEDESEPEADMTFFAGTFVRHPLAIAAAYEVLKKIKEEGPQLQERLTARTTHLTTSLNRFFEEQQFPIRLAQFTSLFRMMFPSDLEYADMLYFHLLDRGIFTRGWGDNCFLSTAHTDQDVQSIIEAVKESCTEIRQGGFFPEPQRSSLASSEMHQKKNDVIDPDAVHCSDPSITRLYNSEQMSTINPIQEEGSGPALFCLPAADGLTLVYHELAEQLGNDRPVYGLDSPAIYREPLPDTLEELAARFVADIREVQPQGPYLLVGYCSGGTTALEVAQQLRRSGESVALLALIETYNWHEAPSTNPTRWVQAHYQYERIKFHLYNFFLLSAREKWHFLNSKFRSLVRRLSVWRSSLKSWWSPSLGHQGQTVNMAEIWRRHDEIAESYRPSKYPGRLINFRPLKDYWCNRSTEYEAENIVFHRLPVYPAGMMAGPFVKRLAELLQREIESGLERASVGQSGNDIANNIAMDIGQSMIAATESEGQAMMVYSE
jgi:glutamate-1-semialdehyde aminotransferase/acyl carrier protein/pimeloyl-ACP methyl ester carboxylesterase